MRKELVEGEEGEEEEEFDDGEEDNTRDTQRRGYKAS